MPGGPVASSVMARLVSKSLQRSVPLNVHLDVTYRCNERCVHCYLDHRDHGEMTTAEIKRVLEELAQAGAFFLTVSGGEIFLRPDLSELLAHARALRFDISLKTNALLVDEARARELKAVGVRRVQVSLYSADPQIHDAVTKIPGSLERTLRGIHLLQQQGLLVKLSCPLMRQNVHAYKGVQALADALGVTYTLDPTITPMLDGDRSVVDSRVDSSELLAVFEDPVFNKRLDPRAAPEQAKPLAAEAPHHAGAGLARAFDNIPCSAGQNNVYISPYGDVYPCVQMPLATGNLRKQSFREIWYGSPQMRRVRDSRESMVQICGGCEIKQYCQRCPGLAQMEDGDMMGPSWRACELAELSARVAGIENPVSAYRQLWDEGKIAGKRAPAVGGLVTIAPLAAAQG